MQGRKIFKRHYRIAEFTADMTALKPQLRWFYPKSWWLVPGLLATTGILFLSERFRWFPFNQHKGYAVLIAVASVSVFLLLMSFWFAIALLFRWRFQFSLRSLLALVVVVALPCSWLAVEMRAARQQREAVQGITNLQGNVAYDWEPERLKDGIFPVPQPPEPSWLRSHLGDDFFDNVIRFDRYSAEGEVGREDEERILDCLSRLTKLRTLDLSNNSVTDADLAKLKGLTDLRLLNINGCELTDAGLESLKGMQHLEELAVWSGTSC